MYSKQLGYVTLNLIFKKSAKRSGTRTKDSRSSKYLASSIIIINFLLLSEKMSDWYSKSRHSVIHGSFGKKATSEPGHVFLSVFKARPPLGLS